MLVTLLVIQKRTVVLKMEYTSIGYQKMNTLEVFFRNAYFYNDEINRKWGWISNYFHYNMYDVITHPCPNFNCGSVKPPLKLWRGWIITPHDDVIKWKHFPRSPVNSPHKDQWRGALMFTLICARINGWVNNREAGDLRRYRAYYDVIVMPTVLRGCNHLSIP